MSNYYLESFKKALENPEMTEERLVSMMENTDFFLKVTRVKLESQDPELQAQAIDELKQLRAFLETQQK